MRWPWSFLLACVSSKHCSALSLLQRTVENWVSIARHLQSPDLYDASWANGCHCSERNGDGNTVLVCSRRVDSAASILSLYPVHAVKVNGDDAIHSTKSNTIQYDIPQIDVAWYRDAGISPDTRISIRAMLAENGYDSPPEGWMGHLASRKQALDQSKANCLVVPLLGAAPLCALVSLGPIDQGDLLVLPSILPNAYDDGFVKDSIELAIEVLRRYSSEISELRSFTTMAHPPMQAEIRPASNQHQLPPQYHIIDHSHPGLETLHEQPDILQIDSFLTPGECQELIDKARPHLQPCLVKNADTGVVELDPTRSSTNTNVPRAEIPGIATKVCRLMQCHPEQLEIFQILHYEPGQKFTPHTDGFDGPVTACGFEHSGRLATVFCYLNDCAMGGETAFPQLDVQVAPKQGRVVVHFPTSIDLREDHRTEHESRPVLSGEKWLLVTWVWKHARSDPLYHEALLPVLSQNVI
jgi:2OG-Fe(II) oxygenase superfamily